MMRGRNAASIMTAIAGLTLALPAAAQDDAIEADILWEIDTGG